MYVVLIYLKVELIFLQIVDMLTVEDLVCFFDQDDDEVVESLLGSMNHAIQQIMLKLYHVYNYEFHSHLYGLNYKCLWKDILMFYVFFVVWSQIFHVYLVCKFVFVMFWNVACLTLIVKSSIMEEIKIINQATSSRKLAKAFSRYL